MTPTRPGPIIDGCRLSFGEVKKYRHNDMDALERVLEACKGKAKLIIVDGIFSMEGDIADLPAIVRLGKAYGARIMVDDAHGNGVLGKGGRGTTEHFGLEDKGDLIMGTYSKSLAAIGGFIAGSTDVIKWIRHKGRSMIFSASPAPSLVASVSTALDMIEEEPELRGRLWRNTHKMLRDYKTLGYDTGESKTPIIPILIKDTVKTYQMCKLLFENGVFVNPVISPAVPPGRELLRTSYMATHTDEFFTYDEATVEEAKALLTDAGYPDGFTVDLVVPQEGQARVDAATWSQWGPAEVGGAGRT